MRFTVLLPLLVATTPIASAQIVEAWYRLDESTGPACEDNAGNGHDGVYDGCTLGQAGAMAGTGTAIQLDGVSDKVDIADGPGFTDLRKELSAACWMSADDFNGVQRFFGNDGSWTWGLSGNSLRFTTRTIKDYDLAVSLATDTWYHIAIVFDSGFDVNFYVDGLLMGTVNGSAKANPPFPDWHIGYKDPGSPEWFGGLLDDIQIYDGVLTDAEVQWLYDHPGQILGSGPVGTNYCGPANLNSSGSPAVISGLGSDTASLNSLELTATGMPTGELGYFVCSQTQGLIFNPGGSQGFLCLGGAMGRFAGQVQSTGSTGEFTISVDLTALPVWPHHAVLPGETWNFQAWFKDGGSSNFSDGLSITYN